MIYQLFARFAGLFPAHLDAFSNAECSAEFCLRFYAKLVKNRAVYSVTVI
jgi:hypothetical protein